MKEAGADVIVNFSCVSVFVGPSDFATYNATKTVLLCNAALSRNFLRDKAGEIRLSAFDLLNRNKSFSRFAGDTYIDATSNNPLRRFFLVSFIYNFKSSPKTGHGANTR